MKSGPDSLSIFIVSQHINKHISICCVTNPFFHNSFQTHLSREKDNSITAYYYINSSLSFSMNSLFFFSFLMCWTDITWRDSEAHSGSYSIF